MIINEKLKNYIEKNIFPNYEKNEAAHNIDHIKYVIYRSLKFAQQVEDINYDMVYTIAAYHDIGHYIDAKNHEKVSAEMLLADKNLLEFFTEGEISIMAEAVYDHRASMESEPRSIYGKIVSSADRNTSVDISLKRTYSYRKKHNPDYSLSKTIEESKKHLIQKFEKAGYAKEKMFFKDEEYAKYLSDIDKLTSNNELFIKRFLEVNGISEHIKSTFYSIQENNPNISLDELLYKTYEYLKDMYKENFDEFRNIILLVNDIDELKYYTKNVSEELKKYIYENIFPKYSKNDGGHNLAHILEVIRRSFALNDTFKLGLDDNIIYTIASCHDWGKYEDHETHHLIAANHFYEDEFMQKFFSDEDRLIIKEAIEDHRSSKEEEPRSIMEN